MSNVAYLAPGVDNTEFQCNLIVVRSQVGVLVSYGKVESVAANGEPRSVLFQLVQCVGYNNPTRMLVPSIYPLGYCTYFGIKNIVSVLLISRMPWANRSSSFARDVNQVSLSLGFFIRSWYSKASPVFSSIMAPAK